MEKFAELVLILSIVNTLVSGDYFKEYYEKWLMREKMECVFDKFDVAEDVPENLLQVQIGEEVIPGDKFSVLNLASRPNVKWDCGNPYIRKHGAESAIVMVAADPGNQSLSWLVDSIAGCDVSAGQEVCRYRSPAPTGARARLYVICQFLRYPSYDKMTRFYAWRRKINPQNFSMVEFAKRGGYGDPYACNFIVLQNDNSNSPSNGQGYDSNRGCDVFG